MLKLSKKKIGIFLGGMLTLGCCFNICVHGQHIPGNSTPQMTLSQRRAQLDREHQELMQLSNAIGIRGALLSIRQGSPTRLLPLVPTIIDHGSGSVPSATINALTPEERQWVNDANNLHLRIQRHQEAERRYQEDFNRQNH